MKMVRVILFLLLIATSSLFGQKEANNWYFGYKNGLTFNKSDTCPNPPCPIYNGMITADEGFATISDTSGELLFYAEGEKVWNKNHEIMENGDGLLGYFSSTQSSLILRNLYRERLYYVFTVDGIDIRQNYFGGKGLHYNIIDMNIENSNGAVVTKNIQLLTDCTEGLSALSNKSCYSYWLITHAWESNEFKLFIISFNSIIGPFIQNIGSYIGNNDSCNQSVNKLNMIKFSPSGNQIAISIYCDGVIELFDFDNSTGIMSNPIQIKKYYFQNIYGMEFSQNGKYLYIYNGIKKNCIGTGIYQYDISSGNIDSIGYTKVRVNKECNSGASIQLSPDGKIYIAYTGKELIDVIEYPNKKCPDCGYKKDFLKLGQITIGGFPNFTASYFYRNKIAISDFEEKIGNELKIPINLNINCSYIQKNIDFYYSLEIQFDASYFYPYDNPLIKSNIVKDGQRILTLEGSFKPESQESIIAEIEGLVLLGNGTKTPIKINKFEILNTEMEVETQDGSLEIYGVCAPEISHIQLFDPLQVKISPIPVSENLKFELRYNTPMDISIVLYNSLSQEILKSEIGKDKVQNELELDVSNLPSGIYFATIKSGTEIITKQFVIMR